MARDAIVSEELAKKFASEKETPYTRWVAKEGLEIISALYVRNLHTVELKPWARRGGRGVFINHDASRTSNDCYVCEIPSGGKLAPQRQLFEEMILILDGRGSTSVWNDAGKKVTFEWQKGSLFAIPLNAWHQHFNGSGQQPARYVAVTNCPPVMNLRSEIPSGGKLAPQRQLFEEMILILDGRGSTSVWNDAGKKVTFEWQKGSLFAIPLNAWHQHFNGSGQQPARYVAVTNCPPVMNL